MRYRNIVLASSAMAMLAACSDSPTVPPVPTSGIATAPMLSTSPSGAPNAVTNECGSYKAGWIFCDDFEQDRSAKYFEYDNAGGKFVRNAGSGVNGSTAMRATYTSGQTGAGSLHLAFGRTPSTYFRAVDAGTANYRELYWRLYVKKEPGWKADGPWKLTRAMILAKSDWTQAAIAHGWSDETNLKYVLLDPASGTNASGSLITSGYNDFTNLRWLGSTRTDSTYDDNAHAGLWECDEFHVRLNDAGQSNAVFEMSVNGHLAARKSGFNWIGSYNAYGLNALFLEQYWNNGAPTADVRDIDNFVVSTQPIACGGTNVVTTPTVATVTVSPATSALLVGQTAQLSAKNADVNGNVLTGQTNVWTSSNGAVATVSTTGLVKAVAAGTATIKATDGTVSGTATVSVTASAPTVATVTVSPATSTLLTGLTVQLAAKDADASGNALTGQTNVWSSSNAAVATVSSTGVLTAVAAGTATIKATDGSVSGTASVSVSTPPVSSGDYAHQPAGFTLFTERAFNSKASSSGDNAGAEGWLAGDESQWPLFSIVQDPTAPRSPGSVGQMKYPAGWSPGYAPGYADKNFTGSPTKVYMSIWVKLSSNFYGHSSYVNKMLFMWMAGQPKFILSADGTGTSPLVPSIRIQDSPDTQDHRWPNVVTSAQIVRGQWQHWEVLVSANTPGQANGQVQWWIDGQLVSDYRNINLAGSGESPAWQIFQWGPTWGGMGGASVPADQYVWWDHVYVSTGN